MTAMIASSIPFAVGGGLLPVTLAILFVLVGAPRDRAKTCEIASLGGLARSMPLLATLTCFAFLALGEKRVNAGWIFKRFAQAPGGM